MAELFLVALYAQNCCQLWSIVFKMKKQTKKIILYILYINSFWNEMQIQKTDCMDYHRVKLSVLQSNKRQSKCKVFLFWIGVVIRENYSNPNTGVLPVESVRS